MAKAAHVSTLLLGAEPWNNWRKANRGIRPELNQAGLSGANLTGSNLAEANLWGANLRAAQLRNASLKGANLRNATLEGADLSGADLRGANLGEDADLRLVNLDGADLSDADLSGADLSRANLTKAIFRRATLSETNLSDAILDRTELSHARVGWTVFAANDLRNAVGLTTVVHIGPSHVGIDSVYKSAGDIPGVFLRGAGISDEFIIYMKSLVGRSIEFYSCFVSYSTEDKEFAERIYADLQTNGVRCWFAPHDIKGGRKIHEQIDEAIRLHDKLLLILSPNSIKSAWVETEIAKARKRELRDERRVLFPVRLVDFKALQNWECFDADTGKDSAREIREFFIPDFSDWKNHDSYQKAFERLLKDLKAG